MEPERLNGENSRWYSRYLIYRNIKPEKRSLLGAYVSYMSQGEKSGKKQYKRVPGSWNDAFEKYDWKTRAEAYDAHLQAEQEERAKILRDIEAAEIEQIMSTGYALKHKRVEVLSDTVDLIKRSFIDEETNKVEFKWVSPDKIRELRGCLDDIAKELGERAKKTEVTGKVEIQRNPDLATLTDEELDQLAELLRKASERQELADAARSV